MTELNDAHHPIAAQPTPEWPDTADAEVGDPSVQAALAVLDGLHTNPVADHEALYGELHDALLESLNEEPADRNGGA